MCIIRKLGHKESIQDSHQHSKMAFGYSQQQPVNSVDHITYATPEILTSKKPWFEFRLWIFNQVIPTSCFSITLGQFSNVPNYCCLPNSSWNKETDSTCHKLTFSPTEHAFFFSGWYTAHALQDWLSHNAGWYSLILRCLWSPPSAGGRWAVQNSKMHSLILHTPADSFEWLSAPGWAPVFRDQTKRSEALQEEPDNTGPCEPCFYSKKFPQSEYYPWWSCN